MANLNFYNENTAQWEEIKVDTRLKTIKNTVTLSANLNYVNIGITSFNPADDGLFVFKGKEYLEDGTDYTLNAGQLRIYSKDGSNWATGTKFHFTVFKNVEKDLPSADGSLLQNGSVTEAKLADSIKISPALEDIDGTIYQTLQARLLAIDEDIKLLDKDQAEVVHVVDYESLKVLTGTGYDWTPAVTQALVDGAGKTVILPPYPIDLYNAQLEIPKFTTIRGYGNSPWHTFGQRRNVAGQEILNMTNGSILRFRGNGTTQYSTNRSDMVNFTCAMRTVEDGDGIHLRDFKILSYFKILDTNGNITSSTTDSHALYDVGLWIKNADHVKMHNVSVVGYWQKVGTLFDASGRIGSTEEYGGIEFTTVRDCVFQGYIGIALLGGDEGNPYSTAPTDVDTVSEGRWGISHFHMSDCFLSGYDHHSNGFITDWQTINLRLGSTPLKIDGYIGSGIPYRINFPRFDRCSFQTREESMMVLNRVNKPSFHQCRGESTAVRADAKNTTNPTFMDCEFPYNRTDETFQEVEKCSGATLLPYFRKLSHIPLKEYEFILELRNHNGVIQHRFDKPRAVVSGGRSKDVEDLFKLAIGAGWSYKVWTSTPVPSTGSPDDYSKGLWLGEKSFISKYGLYTAIAIDDNTDYQEAEAELLLNRSTDTALVVECSTHNAENVSYRMPNYSKALKLDFRLKNGNLPTNPATSLLTSLPNENNGAASVKVLIKGKFYEQSYGLI